MFMAMSTRLVPSSCTTGRLSNCEPKWVSMGRSVELNAVRSRPKPLRVCEEQHSTYKSAGQTTAAAKTRTAQRTS